MALTFPGNTNFEQSEPAQWQPSGWDLDRLVVPFRGDVDQLEAYLTAASSSRWSASALDGAMFLESWANDGHKQFPTVSLTYLGRKGGSLPPTKRQRGKTVQQSSFSSFTGKTEANVTYLAPTSTSVIWSRQEIDPSSVTVAYPADVTFLLGTYKSDEGLEFETEAEYLALFTAKDVETGECEEVVPNQYFRVTRQKQKMLFSVQF